MMFFFFLSIFERSIWEPVSETWLWRYRQDGTWEAHFFPGTHAGHFLPRWDILLIPRIQSCNYPSRGIPMDKIFVR